MKAEGLSLADLQIQTEINEADKAFVHIVAIEAKQVGLKIETSARIVKVHPNDLAIGRGFEAEKFQKVVVLHDPKKKAAPKPKAAPADEK